MAHLLILCSNLLATELMRNLNNTLFAATSKIFGLFFFAFALASSSPALGQTIIIVEDISVRTSIDETSLSLYPNPAADKVTVSVAGVDKIESIRLVDLSGKVVYEWKQDTFGKTQKMGLHSFSAGIYLVQLETPQGLLSKRLVIKR